MVEVVRGNTQFALDLYGELRPTPGNLFVSPYSLSSALAMTHAGARGETAHQMATTLDFSLPQDRLHPAFAALNTALLGDGARPFELRVANALWGQKSQTFLPEFLGLTKEYYGAGLRTVDFNSPEQARRVINAWVEAQTKDKIKDLIGPDAISPDTRLVLTNAIYLKAAWARPFPKEATKAETFSVTPHKVIPVPTMHLTESFGYFDGGSFQGLELPYAGGDLSLVVVLPKTVEGLGEVEAKFPTDWLNKLARRQVAVSLPRFRVESAFELREILGKMGMTDAFGGDADFSGMTGERDLFISAVLHKAFVDVDEAGTEAAAATGVVMSRLSGQVRPPVEFRADHPFLFLIRDTQTGSILFLGRVVNPRG